jgi:hypothetical protein
MIVTAERGCAIAKHHAQAAAAADASAPAATMRQVLAVAAGEAIARHSMNMSHARNTTIRRLTPALQGNLFSNATKVADVE